MTWRTITCQCCGKVAAHALDTDIKRGYIVLRVVGEDAFEIFAPSGVATGIVHGTLEDVKEGVMDVIEEVSTPIFPGMSILEGK